MILKSILLIIGTIYISNSFPTLKGEKPAVITYVTGLWNVNRGNLNSEFKRSFEYYLHFFSELLETQSNLIIFGDNELKDFVQTHRTKNNTVFIEKDLKWFETNLWHTSLIGKVIDRLNETDPEKFKQYAKLPQYGLRMYNPVVMSKLYLLNEALEYDVFNSKYFVWLDGGLTHVIKKQYVVPKQNIFQRIPLYFQGPFFFHTGGYPQLVHGYQNEGERYVKQHIIEFVHANYIGGRTEAISTVLSVFQNFNKITLENYDMWTDESTFSLMLFRYPYLVVSLYGLDIQNFDYVKFRNPRYQPTQQIRYFEFSKINQTIQCKNIEMKQKDLVILRQSNDEISLKARVESRFHFILKDFLQQKLHYQQMEFVKLLFIIFVFIGIYLYLRNQMNKFIENGLTHIFSDNRLQQYQ